MRTVHETEALRPSDPVPKHHSSNPLNKFQRLRLVFNADGKKEKVQDSTPASPTIHPPLSTTGPVPAPSDAEYAHNNIVYMQDLASPNAPTMVQFPPDINFTDQELALPAPDLFRLLRRQLLWATQEGEQLRAEADVLEKKRKREWEAKELIFENMMEAEFAKSRRRRMDEGVIDEPENLGILLEEDIMPSKKLAIDGKGGKMPWWRDDDWIAKLAEAKDIKQSVPEKVRTPEVRQEDLKEEAAVAEEAS
jgi:hypothetical protein